MSKTLKNLVLVVVMCSMITGLLLGCGLMRPTVDLKDYVVYETTGINEYGSVRLYLDADSLFEDYADKIKIPRGEDEMHFSMVVGYFCDTFPITPVCEDAANLANGDTISVSWDVDTVDLQNVERFFHVNFKYDDYKYTVSGLEEAVEIDPFENFPVIHNGINGHGSINTQVTEYFTGPDGRQASAEFVTDGVKTTNFSNGETVHFRLKDPENKEYLLQNGIRLTREEADIELNCFPYYPEDPYEILNGLTEEMRSGADHAVNVKLAENPFNNWLDNGKLDTKIEFCTSALAYRDELLGLGYSNNCLILIYKLTNELVPEGWYVYFVPESDVSVNFDENGNKYIGLLSDEPLRDGYISYRTEEYQNTIFGTNDWVTFKVGDYTFVGHRTIEECLEGCEEDCLHHLYDHIVRADDQT